jgi:TolB-like protein
MSAERAALDALIESVADGEPVDWQALDAAAPDEPSRRRLRHLRLVAGIAEVHRTLPDDVEARTPLPPLAQFHDRFPRWGHLLLLDRIGEGAFGEVYHARDPWLDREVALKLVRPSGAGDVSSMRALKEAQALARVRHPNVVTVHGAHLHDGRVGLWMELLRGQTLEQLLAARGPFDAAEAASIGRDVCGALAAVHAAGLIHRDVKAANVMRDADGRTVLMDFGAGEALEMPTLRSRLAGTPLYLAPEVHRGRPATVQSDLYAVGVLLFRLVTGEYPVQASSLDDLRAAHEQGERRRLQDLRPGLPAAFVSVVERAIDPVPERRFANASAMQTALAELQGPAVPVPGSRFRLTSWRVLATAAVLAVAIGSGIWAWRGRGREASPADLGHVSRLAVMSFQNESPDEAAAYLADSVPQGLASLLGEFGAVKVIPWTYMKRFDAASSTSLKDVAERTGADVIVQGSVQRIPSASPNGARSIHVNVQVFHAGTGTLLWRDSFEREIGDFFALQAAIARQVASRINVVLGRREEMLLSRTRHVSSDAMEDYLKGRDLLETNMDVTGALKLFLQAVGKEPEFAEAYAWLSSCYALQSAYFEEVPSEVALQRALEASNRAIQIDPNLAEGWSTRAFARFTLEWNWPGAEADFQKALELGPQSVAVLGDYSNYLANRGRTDEAIAAARLGEDHAPMSVAASRAVGWALYMARRYDDTIQQLRHGLTIEPNHKPSHTLLGRALMLTGRTSEGLEELQQWGTLGMRAAAFAQVGNRAEALRLLDEARSATPPEDPYHVALVYVALADAPSALDALEQGYRERTSAMVTMGVDPMLDPIRSEPRFQALLARMRLP